MEHKLLPMRKTSIQNQKLFSDNQNGKLSPDRTLISHNRSFLLSKKEQTACDQATD